MCLLHFAALCRFIILGYVSFPLIPLFVRTLMRLPTIIFASHTAAGGI